MPMWLHARSGCGTYQSRVPISPLSVVTIGRRPDSDCAVTWDPEVSRQHAELKVRELDIQLACLPHARNPIFVESSPTRLATLSPNSTFQIGKTVFCVTKGKSSPRFDSHSDRAGDEEEGGSRDQFAYDSAELRQVSLSDSPDQMQVLCDLPEIAAAAGSDIELAATLADTLLQSIPQAVAVAAIECEALSDAPADQAECAAVPLNMRVATKEFYTGRFRPSRRLMGQALQSGKSVVYRWDHNNNSAQATISDALNWAFCVPLSGASRNWCLYIAGEGGMGGGLILDEKELKADLKFTQVLGRFIASFRQVRQLQEQKTRLSSFFSPKVIESLTGDAVENALSATESDVTVLFCDVRGFSRKSEEYGDRLPYLLECVRAALGVMTQQILRHDGAIADFQGDAALGFWGWPVAPEQGAVPACLAALAIQKAFSQAS
ncbi:MAG: FHA domain-containing protein, partial [Planctomycetota bacterium]